MSKVQRVRAASFQPPRHRDFSRNDARGWTRAVRCCLVLFACLAQLLVPAQHQHAPGFASHTIVFTTVATSSGLTLASFDAEQSGVRCAPDFAHSGSHDDGTPPPCQHDNCPCCPTVHAAAGILPADTTRVAYAPRLSEAVAPPARLGTFTRFAAFAGQPRAPPILI
ncbi:MAG: DUF2946 family protein [Methylocella sp.]